MGRCASRASTSRSRSAASRAPTAERPTSRWAPCGSAPRCAGGRRWTSSLRQSTSTGIARRVAEAPEAGGAPVLVSFDRLVHWAKPRILCALDALPSGGTDAAGAPRGGALAGAPALAESLKGETTARGFSPDLKPFHAHVTVARKVAQAPAAQPLRPVPWTFDAFALIESRTEPTGPVYSVIESYLLGKTENEHE